MDVWDAATEKEEQFRELALQSARSHADEHPTIECGQCFGAVKKGLDCQFYSECLQDWTRSDNAKKRNGNAS